VLTAYTLQISTVPLFLGLGASCVLTLLALLLTRDRKGKQLYMECHAPEEAGLLQWAFLFGNAGNLPDAVIRAIEPTTAGLRAAGLVDMWDGVDVRRRKTQDDMKDQNV
jgi:hypothetical protein